MSETAANRLKSELEGIIDALHAENYASVEERIGAYDHSLRACFSQQPPLLTVDECKQLQKMQNEIQSCMQQVRDEAADWLRAERRTRYAVQAYGGRGSRRLRGL